ncbi:MAG: ABC-2 family transporter protein [Myxococcales bacterium]|nr:ABC-2 family transporter protein [Myxococcales bacterium]
MSPPLRAYARYARCAFQRRAAYRLANVTGVLVNFFFFLIHAQVFLAFFGDGGRTVAGWSAHDTVLYFATSEALMMALGVMTAAVGIELSRRVLEGDVVVDLARPVRLWARHLGEAYGDAVYFLLARTVVLYGGACLTFSLVPPLAPRLLLLPLSLVLGTAIGALSIYVAAASAYWLENPRGPVRVVFFATFICGGVVVPLDFYPDGFRSVCELLPFRGAVYTPVALATGKLEGAALLNALAHQLGWTLALMLAAHTIELRGVRRLAALGG